MSEVYSKFLTLSKKYESLKAELDTVREQMTTELIKIGVGTYFQDPETMAVFKVVIPKGKFVYYENISYERTALEGETRGTLSKKEANEKGFSQK